MDQEGVPLQLPGQDGQQQPQQLQQPHQLQQPKQPGTPQVPLQLIQHAPMAMNWSNFKLDFSVIQRRIQRQRYSGHLIGWTVIILLQVKEYKDFLLHQQVKPDFSTNHVSFSR